MAVSARNHTLEIVETPPLRIDDEQPGSTSVSKGEKGKRAIKRGVLTLLLLAGATYFVHYGHQYWTVDRFTETTDNAYVKADFTAIAPKVSGYIKNVLVKDNETVKEGQVLARIDDRDFQAALSQAKADVSASDASIAYIDAQIALQESLIVQATAAVNASKASFKYAYSEAARAAILIASGAGSQSRVEQSHSLREQASAAVERDEAGLIAARNKVPVLQTQRDQAVAQRDKTAAVLRQAELNLSYTEIVSAISGTVGARTIRVGQLVAAGTQLMAVVPLDAVYVVANYKETQLANVRAGQSAKIEVDGLPGVIIKGHVDSISPASGLDFSLLPPDNATGNFTKIVQRIPVKIVIDDVAHQESLRSGMSVESTIDIQAADER